MSMLKREESGQMEGMCVHGNFPSTCEPCKKERLKKPLWEKITTITKKMLMYAALLEALGGGAAYAETKREREKIDARAKVEFIVKELKTKGQPGTLAGTLEQTPIRRWQTKDGSRVMVGYDKSGKATWLIHENEDATVRLFDQGADGSWDRLIINKEKPPLGTKQKTAFNNLKTFSSIDSLAQEARLTADLQPEKVSVFSVERSPDGTKLKAINFANGETAELVGKEAGEQDEKTQDSFAEKATKVADELTK